jgi:hypothetical protein
MCYQLCFYELKSYVLGEQMMDSTCSGFMGDELYCEWLSLGLPATGCNITWRHSRNLLAGMT